jgi:hypothetical protein
MAAKHTRLELTWIGKGERPRLEPRILLEDPELSYHAKKRFSEDDIFDNTLIHGDNLLALKALLISEKAPQPPRKAARVVHVHHAEASWE